MRNRKAEARAGLLFALPWFFGFLVFMAYPVLASMYYSLCEYSVLKPPVYVGLANYADLAHDDVFWLCLWNTIFYTVLSLPIGTGVAIGLALLLNAKVRGQAFYRTIFYLPSLLPLVASAMLWLWVFNGEYGILNSILNPVLSHVPFVHLKGPQWMTDPAWTKPALVLMSVWGVGNAMVIYLAGLQEVPQELLEASDLDGASAPQKFRHVTIPMISPVILFNVVMGMIGSLQIFVQPYVMFPKGVPAHASYFYAMYLYDNAFVYHKMGYACAMGWILFLMIFFLTLFSIKISEKKVYYGGG